jgi:glycosyltransferase involved in cell wall biosynthesis
MSAAPLVTINVPTYNQAGYIERAIGSALAQDYPNFEVVVCDDHSSDGTLERARTLSDPRLRITANPARLGRVANYRHCLYDLARGEWVVNLDGDDQFVDPSFVSGAVAALQAEPDAILYAAGSLCLHEADGSLERAPMDFEGERIVIPGTDYVLLYPRLGATQHFSVLYNRARALETDFYSIDALGTDTDSLMRLALKGKVVVEKKWVGAWTYHDRNASYSLTDATVEAELAMLRRVAAALAVHVPPDRARRWLDRQIAEKRRFALVLQLSKLPVGEAARLLARRARPDLLTAREAAKLLLRAMGLR